MITFVTATLTEGGLKTLRKYGEVCYQPLAETHQLLGGRRLVQALSDVDIFITEADNLREREINMLKNLQVICSCRGNPVNIDVQAATAKGIPVINTPARNADAVADLTVALMLMLARHIPQAASSLRDRDPGSDMNFMAKLYFGLRGTEMWQKTVGIVGMGAIGRKVAERLAPFGVRLIASDPYVSKEVMESYHVTKVNLDTLMSESDFVSLHVMVNDSTRGLVGKRELSLMKKSAYFINTARSAITDEMALVELLREQKIAGAGLDVFDKEPLPVDHPLMALDNVILLPHIGGNTHEIAHHQTEILIPDIECLVRNERPRNIINPEVLYGFRFRV